jgi:hypothetical protein
MARHSTFPHFLGSTTCSRLRRVRITTNHNMETILQLLAANCLNLTSLEVLTFIGASAGTALLHLLKTTPRLTTLKVRT